MAGQGRLRCNAQSELGFAAPARTLTNTVLSVSSTLTMLGALGRLHHGKTEQGRVPCLLPGSNAQLVHRHTPMHAEVRCIPSLPARPSGEASGSGLPSRSRALATSARLSCAPGGHPGELLAVVRFRHALHALRKAEDVVRCAGHHLCRQCRGVEHLAGREEPDLRRVGGGGGLGLEIRILALKS